MIFHELSSIKVNGEAKSRAIRKTPSADRVSKVIKYLKCGNGELDSQVGKWMPKMEKRLLGCFSKQDRQIVIEEGMVQVALCAKNLDAELIEQIRKLLMAVEESERPRMMLQGVVRLFYADPKLGRGEVKSVRKGLEGLLPQERCAVLEKEVIPGIWEDRKMEGSRGKRLRKLETLLECIRNSDYSTRKRDVADFEDKNDLGVGNFNGRKGEGEAGELKGVAAGDEKVGAGDLKSVGGKGGFGDLLGENGLAKGADLEGRKNGKAHAKGDEEAPKEEEGQTPSNCQGSLTT